MFMHFSRESAREYIPFEKKKFRPGQWEAIEKSMEAIMDNDKYIILNAPVGVGKSLIGYILAKMLEEDDRSTYMYTKTKMLQDQYIKDFKDVRLVKGRSNFICENESFLDCSHGMCQSMASFSCPLKPILKEKWEFDDVELPDQPIKNDLDEFIFYGDKEFDDFYTKGMCPYWKQKIEGIMNPITMLNYNYAISDSRFVQQLPFRKLGVYDEAHNIEQIIMNELEYRFSPSTVEKETQFKITDHRTIDDWIDDIEKIINLYKEMSSSTVSESTKKKFQDKLSDFKALYELLVDDPSNWVVTQEKERGHLFFVFKPIKVNDYTHLLFKQNQTCLLMTGTVLKPDIFARDLGIDEYTYIEIPSIVPVQNRPIIKSYVGSMARSSIDATMPNMIVKIKMLAEKHQSEKGLIHTFTYSIADRLQKALKGNNRFIFHNQKNKDKRFKEFKKNKTNKILVSPVAFEGIDFPYDEARWQCICKDPFPNIGDPQVRVRDAIDYGWLFRQRCLVLSQMYGRTNRAADDYSITYLLDSRLDTLLGPATLVTDYFLEALEGFNYNCELILAEDAYDRLTKDNKRKSHEVDRFQELAVLDAIKDENLNSLHKLRAAYKEMEGESYTLVIPTVQRLIKNGAIYYNQRTDGD